MKQIKFSKKGHAKRNLIITGVLITLILILIGGFILVRKVNSFFDKHYIQFNKIVTVEVKKPMVIKDREVPTKEIVRVMEEIPSPVDLVTEPEKYIYEKFGIENYKIAIAIARAESGMREDAININSNGTIDLGIFQINSVHFKKDICALKNVVTYKGNIDCAYEIYKDSSWNPWVAFTNGSFISKLE